jgi:hypothetical protein
MLPLLHPWMARLAPDFDDAHLTVLGFQGADFDLRSGLAEACSTSRAGRGGSEQATTRHRFAAASARWTGTSSTSSCRSVRTLTLSIGGPDTS